MHTTSISKAGLALAGRVAAAYRPYKAVRLVMAGGSVSRGCADEYSDLEVGVFWAKAPDEETRRAAITTLGAEILAFDRDGASGREHVQIRRVGEYTGTSMVSCIHTLVADAEETLRAVVDDLDTDLEKQVFCCAVQRGVALHGADLLRSWQERINAYPENLAIKTIQQNLWFGPFYCPQAYIARGDFVVLYQHYLWAAHCLLRILAALNRLYCPSEEHKWAPHFIAEMEHAPADLAARLQRVFAVPLDESWPLLKTLLSETVDLVETHLPAVNSKKALFADKPEINADWARKRLEPFPPYTLLAAMAEGG